MTKPINLMQGYGLDGQPDTDPGTWHGGVHQYDKGCEYTPKCRPLVKKPAGAEPDTAYDPPPAHYGGGQQIDPWAVWDAFDLDRYTANAVKYLLRAGKKDIAPRLDDLIKARNYINKAIEMEQKNVG